MPTNILLDVILSLIILMMTTTVFKQKDNKPYRFIAITLIIVHIVTVYLDYFTNNEVFKYIANTSRFILTVFLAYKLSKENKRLKNKN